jgi:pimeloyl-ACP methyl ester carboxylesterase
LNPQATEWFRHRFGLAPRGVALMMHGLNLNPDRMQPLVGLLTGAGFDVLMLSLRGHGDNFARCAGRSDSWARLRSFRSVSCAIWESEARGAYDLAQARAVRAGVPLALLGYSLGALLGVELQATGRGFERMVLLAPPLSLRRWLRLVRPLAEFPWLVLPSIAGADLLANAGTPMCAYKALLETFERFETRNGDGLDVPTLVLIDPGDELISFAGVAASVRARGLRRWHVQPIRKDAGTPRGIPHHLMIDERWVGPGAWAAIGRAVTGHLTADPP